MTRSVRTGLHPVWRGFLLRLALIVTAAAVVAVAAGSEAGLAALAGLTVLLMAERTRHMVRLARWIDSRDDAEFPEAGGAWGQVFLTLSRRLREEAKRHAASEADAAAFRDAMAALPDGIVLLDPLAQVLWCNPAAERHLGIRCEMDRGLVITHLVRAPGFADFLKAALRPRSFTLPSADDRSRVLGLDLVAAGEGRRLLVSFDLTELQQAEAMRRDFVANVSHELRTPLTVIHGFLEHLAGGELSDGDRGEFVRLMQDQSERMLRLVDDLLTLSRLESDRSPRREETVDMAALVARLADEAAGLSGGRHRIESQVAAVDLRGDADELRSAFSNLVSNAVRYTPPGGRIAIAWADGPDGPCFSVADSGIGIPPDAVPRLTERFYRVDKGRSRETGGTGLGLAIVKHVLIRHQAELRIDSTPGEGSTFTVRLPVARRVPAGGDTQAG